MLVSAILLITILLFVIVDVAMGCWRGLFSALIRLGEVIVCAVIAFFLAPVISHWLLELPLVNGESIQAVYDGFIGSYGEVSAALELSEGISQLVYHLPEVLVNEIMFVALFFALRLLTLPIHFLVSRLVDLPGKMVLKKAKKAANAVQPDSATERKKRSKYRAIKSTNLALRFCGVIPGVVQALVCVLILMVPLFGMVEFGERFSASFSDSNQTEIVAMAEKIDDDFVEPINNSVVGKVCGGLGIKQACIGVFHLLSETELEVSGKPMRIDYFEFMESLFEPIDSLLKLSNVDPEHMTDQNYEDLSAVLQTAQTNEHKEYIEEAVKGGVTDVVTQFVDDSFRNTADIVVESFTDKLLDAEEPITGDVLKKEVNAIRDTLTVIQTATSESAESAFEVIKADTLVDGLIQTDLLYGTLIEVVDDPENLEILRNDLAANTVQKENIKTEIEKYRNESSAVRSEEEMTKILEITDALAKVFDVDLSEFEFAPVYP